jgi:hypothetical protein
VSSARALLTGEPAHFMEVMDMKRLAALCISVA